MIVSDVLSGVWKSVISIPIKEIISCLPSRAIPTYELYSQLVSSDNLWKEKQIQVIIFSLFTASTRSWEHKCRLSFSVCVYDIYQIVGACSFQQNYFQSFIKVFEIMNKVTVSQPELLSIQSDFGNKLFTSF